MLPGEVRDDLDRFCIGYPFRAQIGHAIQMYTCLYGVEAKALADTATFQPMSEPLFARVFAALCAQKKHLGQGKLA
jgi:hypothetical protein